MATPDPVPPARRDEGEIEASSACPICSRSTPHSEEHHQVESELLMAAAMGDANATWLRPARHSPKLSLPSLLAQMVDRLIDEVVRLRAARGRAEGSAQAIDLAQKAAEQRGYQRGIEQAAKALQPWVDDPKAAGMRAGPPVPPSIRMWAKHMQDVIRALLGGADRGA